MAHERKCMVCGTEYKYCAHGCKEYEPSETWRYLFDSENCLAIYDIWQYVRGKQMSREEAVEALKKVNLDKVIGAKTMVSNDIEEMLGVKSKVEVEPEMADKTAEPKVEEKPVEEEPSQDRVEKFDKHYNGKRNDYKKK